jgi:ankyrin repeat protein
MQEISEKIANEKKHVLLQLPDKIDVNFQLKDGRTALMFACCNNDLNVVKDLINKGADVNLVENEFQNSALFMSISKNKIEISKYLINNGANVNLLNIYNENVLFWAVVHKNYELVELLCNKGCNINIFNNKGQHPLFLAIKSKEYEIVKILIKYKANLEMKETIYEDTPLLASMKSEEIACLLIESGADIHAENKIKDTPIHIATLLNNFPVVKKLYEKGADLNKMNDQSHNPIIFATGNGYVEIFKFLLDKNVNLDVKDVNNEPLLNICIIHNRLEMIELLILKDTNLINKIDYNYKTPLDIAVKLNKLDFVKLLLKHGANPNPKKSVDYSPIHEAFINKNYQIIDLLIKYGVDKMHLLNMYIWFDNFEDIEPLIIKNKYLINQKNTDYYTPLMCAASQNKIKIVELLLKYGANPNINNYSNRSPLFEAVYHQNYDMVKLLIENGADINIRERLSTLTHNISIKYGNSILGYAKKTFNRPIIDHLEDLNAIEEYEIY